MGPPIDIYIYIYIYIFPIVYSLLAIPYCLNKDTAISKDSARSEPKAAPGRSWHLGSGREVSCMHMHAYDNIYISIYIII